MAVTSWFTRTSTLNRARKFAGVITSSQSRSGMIFPRWYGSPQFAYDMCGPRSNSTISAFSSSRRNRAAALAPPATPPMMIVFMNPSLPRQSPATLSRPRTLCQPARTHRLRPARKVLAIPLLLAIHGRIRAPNHL